MAYKLRSVEINHDGVYGEIRKVTPPKEKKKKVAVKGDLGPGPCTYSITGLIDVVDNSVHIRELPVSTWTENTCFP